MPAICIRALEQHEKLASFCKSDLLGRFRKLTRFRGHRNTCVQGADGEDENLVRTHLVKQARASNGKRSAAPIEITNAFGFVLPIRNYALFYAPPARGCAVKGLDRKPAP
jgi:hypothetical protein